MLATSKNALFPRHNHLLTTNTDDSLVMTRWRSGDYQSVGSSVPVVGRWLRLGNRTFLEVASIVVTCQAVVDNVFFCAMLCNASVSLASV